MIGESHKKNFETLKQAFSTGNVALLECIDRTGNTVVVLCAVGKDDEHLHFTPFARFFNGNPYDELEPPNVDARINSDGTIDATGHNQRPSEDVR